MARVPLMARDAIFWALHRSKRFAFSFKITMFPMKYYEETRVIQKFIETRKELELIETGSLTYNISKNASNEFSETRNSFPDILNCLKKQAYAILIIFSSTYACETLFSEMNKDLLRNRLADSNSACILLKVTSYNPNISDLSSNPQQQKSH
ncbi:dimer_Tnp_hAT domain-containing protein [Trichonephila clavipes]|nr:dimer_Tnp_hAT domain-containing protein [Trichonephila clavipes]